jgi:hypothetical protein
MSQTGSKDTCKYLCQEKNASQEQWTGIRLGIAGAKKN